MLFRIAIVAGVLAFPLGLIAQEFGPDPRGIFGDRAERTENTRPLIRNVPTLSDLDQVRSTDEPRATLDGGRSINLQLLETVRDDTLGLQPEDRAAYFAGLQACRHIRTAQLEEWSAEFLQNRQTTVSIAAGQADIIGSTFGDVLEHPQGFRGQLVSMRGCLRRLVKYDPGQNRQGFRHVYEAWVYPDDSQGNPVVVVFTKKPNGLPMGADLSEDVQFTGYFLKNYGYEAQDVPRRAPLFLAGGVDWLEMPELVASVATTPLGYGSTAVLFFACVFGVVHFHRDRRYFRATAPVFDADGQLLYAADTGDFVTTSELAHFETEHHH